MKKNNFTRSIVPYLLLFTLIAAILYFLDMSNDKVNKLTYNEFVTALNKEKVTELEITPRISASVYEFTGKLEGYKKEETFFVRAPLSEKTLEEILGNEKSKVKIVTKADPDSSAWINVIINLLPILLLIGATFYIITRQMGGSNKSMDFGKSKAKLNEEHDKTNFSNVAGLDEEKLEVSELIDFLKTPKKFQKMGARIPKGVLLVGPPGTGKTLLAKAVAGEAKVPFYFISGSDFVELFVGIGASRVRDMFKQAKNNAPCLIFIDEIDAVGRQRGTGLGGGHDEREQTLNQLLTEMDGFGSNEGIIIIAATNRADVLDPALLRPGRFDRQILVNLPDKKSREDILKVHATNKKLGPKVTLARLAERTPGFSGADLENLLNEAALLTVRRNKEMISMSEIDEATDRVLMGPAKASRKYTEKDKRLVAYHEAGHVILGIKLNDAQDVHKVTIIPRSNAGGYAMMIPREERYTATKKELLEEITGLLGGRVTEEIAFDEITTGASTDFGQATKIARSMVTEYGMSDLGPMQLEHKEEMAFLGRDYNKTRNFSDQVALEIDEEVRKIINNCYATAQKIVKENMDLVKLIADNLIKHETLTKEQIDYLVEHQEMPIEKLIEDYNLDDLKALAKEKNIKGYSKMKKEEIIRELQK